MADLSLDAKGRYKIQAAEHETHINDFGHNLLPDCRSFTLQFFDYYAKMFLDVSNFLRLFTHFPDKTRINKF